MKRAQHMADLLRYRAASCAASPSSCCLEEWYDTPAAYVDYGGDECLDAWIDYAYAQRDFPHGGTNPPCLQPQSATPFLSETERLVMILTMNEWFGHNLDGATYGDDAYVTHAYRKLRSCIFFDPRFDEYVNLVTDTEVKRDNAFKRLFPAPQGQKLSNRHLDGRIREFKAMYMKFLKHRTNRQNIQKTLTESY